MRIEEMLDRIAGITLEGNPCVEISGISHDSRRVKPGDMFVALKGEKTDGALYLSEAIRRGAAALASDHRLGSGHGLPVLLVPDARQFLAESSRWIYQDPAAKMQLVAITGTNGKTTTACLVDAIFRKAGLPSCLVGTLGMSIGDRPFPSNHTTPEASDLTAFLRQALTEGCTHGVLEVSSHALALKRVFGTRFTVAVFSNLTPEHLDFHHDMESYYRAKRILFSPEGANSIGTSVLNIDDAYGRRLAADALGTVLRYGFDPAAEVHVLSSRTRTDGIDLRLSTPWGELEIESPLIGRPNVYNIMAAAAAALCLEIPLRGVRLGIESLSGVPGRLEPVRGSQPYTVIVDYAHSPDALEKLLGTVRQLTRGRLIAVFGCGGDRDRGKRPLMGEIATRLSDLVIATTDNPRSEDPAAILAEIESGLKRGTAPYRLLPDRREAIRTALSQAAAGDAVVIAGKGHESYQVIGAEVLPFDDRAVAGELIRELCRKRGE